MANACPVLYRLGLSPWEANRDDGPLAEVVVTRPPGRAPDAGCGTGRHAVSIAEHGWTVTAVDGVGQARYDRVLDVGCFHGPSETHRAAFASWGYPARHERAHSVKAVRPKCWIPSSPTPVGPSQAPRRQWAIRPRQGGRAR
jgi:hypothetical protein